MWPLQHSPIVRAASAHGHTGASAIWAGGISGIRTYRRQALLLILLLFVLPGCYAFEYYGSLPHLRHVVELRGGVASRPESMNVSHAVLTGEAAKEIRLLTTLREVTIQECEREAGAPLLEPISRLPRLTSLELRHVPLHDEELQYLSDLEHLERLELIKTEVSGQGLRFLRNLPVKELTIVSSEITADSLQVLSDLPRLQELYLDVAGLDMSSMPALGHLPRFAYGKYSQRELPAPF